jgi:hypothetical protein
MLSDLKPQSKELVYTLVAQSGLDISDWANFNGAKPAANPKYCFEWAFWEADRPVVLCLWYSEMQERNGMISQTLNYRIKARQFSGIRAKRARHMDEAFQLAATKRLPIRVIVVDGIRRGVGGAKASKVSGRMLDPTPWRVSAYDADSGECSLVRGQAAIPTVIAPAKEQPVKPGHYLARLSHNSANWERPTREAQAHEAEGTYNEENGFGHEDWLFRDEWEIDGWRYAFIQGVNKSFDRLNAVGKAFDLTLFSIDQEKRRRYVAQIRDVECLQPVQAEAALDIFRREGWFETMKQEVTNIGGKVSAMESDKRAKHILNVRFRLKDVRMFPDGNFAAANDPILKRNRYTLSEMPQLPRILRVPDEPAEDDTVNDLPGLDPSTIGSDGAPRVPVLRSGVKRDPRVRTEVRKRSRGTCERPGCGARRDYPGFIDVHHILAAENSDRSWTCVALCPNCHREAHYAPYQELINAELLQFALQFK